MINFRELSKEITNEREKLMEKTKDALFRLEKELKRNWNFDLELLDLEIYDPGYESGKEKLVLVFDANKEEIVVRHEVNHYIEEENIIESFVDHTSNTDHFELGHYKNKKIKDFELDICEEIASYFCIIGENIENQIKEEIENLNNLLEKIQWSVGSFYKILKKEVNEEICKKRY